MKSLTVLHTSDIASNAILASLGALLALAAAAGAEIISWGGLLDSGHLYVSWWRELLFLVSKVTGPYQIAVVFAWALLTGILVATGIGIRHQGIRLILLMTALLTGAIVALGIVFFGEALSGLLPRTNGPNPVLITLLLAYTLVVPWKLGRMITAVLGDIRP